MHKLAGAVAAIAVTLTVAAGSPAATAESPKVRLTSEIQLIPKRTGTAAEPVGARITANVELEARPPDDVPNVITAGRALLPRGIVLHGGDHPRCSKRTLDRDGQQGCPTKSIVGRAGNPALTDARDGFQPKVVLINGGSRTLFAHVTYFYPALFQEVFPLEIEPMRSQRWAYVLRFSIPRSVLTIVEDPIDIPELHVELGAEPASPNYLTTEHRCPKRGFLPYRIELSYERHTAPVTTGRATDRGRIACR